MQQLIDGITHLIATLGYPGVLLLMSLESACIPVPSEAIMPFAGAQITAPTGSFHPNIWALTLIGALGNLLGSVLAYWVGHVGGRPFLDKYGKYVLIRKRDIDKSDAFFAKHGEWTVFFGRWLPIVRTFISLPAGISRMNFPKFCAFTFVGALPFCYLLAWAGQSSGSTGNRCMSGFRKRILGSLLFLLSCWPSGSGTICGLTQRKVKKKLEQIQHPLRNKHNSWVSGRKHGIMRADQVQRRTPVRAIAPGRRDFGADTSVSHPDSPTFTSRSGTPRQSERLTRVQQHPI